jgi:hypothetical protein
MILFDSALGDTHSRQTGDFGERRIRRFGQLELNIPKRALCPASTPNLQPKPINALSFPYRNGHCQHEIVVGAFALSLAPTAAVQSPT